MLSMRGIQSRIEGVKKTKQITNSMRLVASSKVHKSRSHMECNDDFYKHNLNMMRFFSRNFSATDSQCFQTKDEYEAKQDDKNRKAIVVIISTDRGLCGGFNASIARESLKLLKRFSKENIKIVSVGGKIENSLERAGFELYAKYLGLSETPLYEEAKMIAEKVYGLFKSADFQSVYVVYTEYVTILEQRSNTVNILPFPTDTVSRKYNAFDEESSPSIAELIDKYVPEYLGAMIYNCMVKSAASEQSARMTSMDSASRNSDEIVEKLTLTYNQLRQGKITQEINEIASGASVVSQK